MNPTAERLAEAWGVETDGQTLSTAEGKIEVQPKGHIVRLKVESEIGGEDFTWQIHLPDSADPRFVEHTITVFRRQAKGWILDREYLEDIVTDRVPEGLAVEPLPPGDVLDRCWESSMVRKVSPAVRINTQPFGYINTFFRPRNGKPYRTSKLGAELCAEELEAKEFTGTSAPQKAIDALEEHLIQYKGCLTEFANRFRREDP